LAAIDVPDDPASRLRREVTVEELERSRLEFEERRNRDTRLQKTILTVGAIAACLGLGWLISRRAHIAKMADKAIVDAAAHGLRAKRNAQVVLRSFAHRAQERADHKD
jgi:hypothetical protein